MDTELSSLTLGGVGRGRVALRREDPAAALAPVGDVGSGDTTARRGGGRPGHHDRNGRRSARHADLAGGDPVKVGVITPGVGAAFDTSNDKSVTEVAAHCHFPMSVV